MLDKLSNYIIVDIGANLTNKKFSRDLDQVIQRAREAGVTKIMVTGTSIHSTKEALRLTRLYPGTLYSTAGEALSHPESSTEVVRDSDGRSWWLIHVHAQGTYRGIACLSQYLYCIRAPIIDPFSALATYHAITTQ